jgi:hypothetical protein
MAPLLFTIVSSEDNTPAEKAALVSLYLPYLVLPLGILWIACRDAGGGTSNAKGSDRAKKQS